MDGFFNWIRKAGSNAAHAVTGGRVGRDHDLLPNVTFAGGERRPSGGALVGRQVVAPSTLESPSSNWTTSGSTQQAAQASQPLYGGGGVAYDPAYAAAQAEAARIKAAEDAERQAILDELGGYRGEAESVFNDLFARIDQLARERTSRTTDTYGEQDAQYTKEFERAVPEIDNAFAALGIGNSTYAGKRVQDATNEYEGSLATSKKNREADLREIGEWTNSQRTALQGDQRNIMQRLDRASQHNTDLGELRGVRNDIGGQINTLGGRKGAYTAEGEVGKTLDRVGGRTGNFDEALASLQGVLNSSMDTGTKEAAKSALVDNANLTDDEKRRLSEVQANNAYGRPATT